MQVQESIHSDVCLFELHLPVYTFESLFSGAHLNPLRLNKASVWTNRRVVSKVNLPRPAHFPKKALSSLYYMRIALHVCVLSSLKYWIVIKVAATQLSFSIKLTNCKLENSFFPVIIFTFLHTRAALHSRLFSFFKLMLYIFWPYLM